MEGLISEILLYGEHDPPWSGIFYLAWNLQKTKQVIFMFTYYLLEFIKQSRRYSYLHIIYWCWCAKYSSPVHNRCSAINVISYVGEKNVTDIKTISRFLQ